MYFQSAAQPQHSFPVLLFFLFFFFLSCSSHQLLKCSAAKGTADGEDKTTQQTDEEKVQRLSPAVNLEAPLEDDSVRCRMSGICEGLDACGRGRLLFLHSTLSALVLKISFLAHNKALMLVAKVCSCCSSHPICLVLNSITSGTCKSLDACGREEHSISFALSVLALTNHFWYL